MKVVERIFEHRILAADWGRWYAVWIYER